MTSPDDITFRRQRRDNADPASDGTADSERRERQSGLRRTLRERFPDRARNNLLPALHLLQHEHGHLPEWALQVVGWHLRVPASEVYGAATSYSELRLDPTPALSVTVCTGLACWLAGSDELCEVAQAQAGSHDVNTTACAFLCGLAPAVSINGRWLGRMDPGRLTKAIREARE
jgi:NADH:ubiquinone oxidoreductase subunit E